ncbi:hypothetical protein [Thioalkalivibrio sp. ALE16]|uniref:hypothetical protein n=1 Tax=Thioalkalivibrio sp. ALE16 TaxID=1158172 RepID=UPI000380055C|nr:hypothetical protein [Thioalkalivibrio sp. ALE16]
MSTYTIVLSLPEYAAPGKRGGDEFVTITTIGEDVEKAIHDAQMRTMMEMVEGIDPGRPEDFVAVGVFEGRLKNLTPDLSMVSHIT